MNDEIVIAIWPKRIEVWRCPVCGRDLTGRTYNVDASRKKCSKLWHKDTAKMREYRLVEGAAKQWAEIGLAP